MARITGPIEGGDHGFPQASSAVDLAAAGYVELEYFLSGEATSYVPEGTWGEDGRWAVRADRSAPYTTRILVRRPADVSACSGTVVVEWLNVTSLTDIDVDFGYLADEILRRGHVWVGVSAQAAGIESTGGSDLGPAAVGLRAWDPQRYGSLSHPGDDHSYDIFSQAGRVIAAPDGPLAGLPVDVVLADGESQSAHRMVTYVNAVAPMAGVYDGFLIHSRFGNGAPLSAASGEVPAVAHIRDDLAVPVLQVLTETDLFALPESLDRSTASIFITPFPPARQPDTDRICTWEVAGTAHADGDYLRLLSIQGMRQFPGFLDLSAIAVVANNGPQRYVMRAALRALRDRVVDGTPMPGFGFLEVVDGAIVRDSNGNAIGGVRTPQLDVPVALLSGEGAQTVGSTAPFTPEVLVSMYGSTEAFQRAFASSVDVAVKAGAVLADDVAEMLREAQDVRVD